jgi:hydrogenase-4 component F
MLMAVFLGMGNTVLAVVQGPPPPVPPAVAARADTPGLTLPIVGLLLAVLLLGVWLPPPLRALIEGAAAQVEGRP